MPASIHKLYGFRFSGVDALALLVFFALAQVLYSQGFPLWWLVPAAAGHFFLFCNVFRVRRRHELIWAGVFVLNTGWWMSGDCLEWFPPVACQTPLTIAILTTGIRSRDYHGMLALTLNPHLGEYLASRLILKSPASFFRS